MGKLRSSMISSISTRLRSAAVPLRFGISASKIASVSGVDGAMRVLSCAPKGGALRLIGRAAQMIQWVLAARIGPQPHQPLRGDRPAQRRGQRNEGGVAAEDRLRLEIGRAPCRERVWQYG